MKNSFKELQDTQVRLFAQQSEKRVFDKVEGTLNTLRLFGSIFEMYVPVLSDTLLTLSGGEIDSAATEPETPQSDDKKEQTEKLPSPGPDFSTDDPEIR